MRSRVVALGAALLVLLPAAGPVAAQDAALPDGWSMIASGLHAPRGMAITEDGTFYIVEAGPGGTDCVDGWRGPLCAGLTGSIGIVTDGVVEEIVTGIAGFDDAGESVGPEHIVIDADGTIHVSVGGGSNRKEILPQYAEQLGYVHTIAPDGDRRTTPGEAPASALAGTTDHRPPSLWAVALHALVERR